MKGFFLCSPFDYYWFGVMWLGTLLWWKGLSREDVAAVFALDAQSLHSETSCSPFTANSKAVKYAFSYGAKS